VYSNTDLSLTLQTTGKPVQITIDMNVTLGTNSGIVIRPTIDGNQVDQMQASHFVGGAESPHLTFSRLYSVPQGTHTFTAQFSCQAGVTVGLRWMIVDEL
jgi:hypothetical protein